MPISATIADVVVAINAAISELEKTVHVAPETVLGATHFIRISTEMQMEADIRAQLEKTKLQ